MGNSVTSPQSAGIRGGGVGWRWGSRQPAQACQSLRFTGESKGETGRLVEAPESPWQDVRAPRLGFPALLLTEAQKPCLLRFHLLLNQRLKQQMN